MIYEIYTDRGTTFFEGDNLVLWASPIDGEGRKVARIPLSEFESGEC